jgi:hypothetical protein
MLPMTKKIISIRRLKMMLQRESALAFVTAETEAGDARSAFRTKANQSTSQSSPTAPMT